MPTPVLAFPPIREDYSFIPGYGVVSTRLDGGAQRQRLDVIGSPHTMEVQWMLSGHDYTLFMGFFRDTLTEGTLPFLFDILADVRYLTTHKARCMDGRMPRLIMQKGDSYWVKATLEVEKNATHTGSFQFSTAFLRVDTFVTMPEYIIGDKFRLIDSFKVGTSGNNFDGTYVVTAVGSTTVTAAAASSVNPEWSLGGTYTIPATITQVPV